MGNHFRKPGDGQGVRRTQERPASSHFAYSSADEEEQVVGQTRDDQASVQDPFEYHAPDGFASAEASGVAAAPSSTGAVPSVSPGDTGEFLASAGVTVASPAAPASPIEGTGAITSSIPDPMAPAPSQVGADQKHEVSMLDNALKSTDFTSVFAPVEGSRKQTPHGEGVDPVIVMEHVTKVYPAQPNKPALDDVNLKIYPGEFVFLVGHSGSGKSTLLRTLMREVKPTSGRVIVAGQDLMRIRNRKVPYLRRQMGIVFQDFRLLPNKSAYQNVAFALECIGKPRGVIRAQVPEVLRLVGLADQMHSTPDQLSGGEQQRVNVARAMVNRPPLLICDEPTGNLDPAISLGIMKLLERINRTGTTVIVATHDREMVDSMHRRVIALEAGHVIRDQERGGYGNYGTL